MSDAVKNVLILCTGNSARSILGEALINRLGEGRFRGFSAGSAPLGRVNPFAIRLLNEKGFAVEHFRSKSWDEFSNADASQINFAFTVCDNAARETCPVWHGQPIKAHWGIPDPAAKLGTNEAKMTAFGKAYKQLEKRIRAFVALPLADLDEANLQNELNAIGRMIDGDETNV